MSTGTFPISYETLMSSKQMSLKPTKASTAVVRQKQTRTQLQRAGVSVQKTPPVVTKAVSRIPKTARASSPSILKPVGFHGNTPIVVPRLSTTHSSVVPQGPHPDSGASMRRWSSSHVPYLATLEDPLHNAGICIPDSSNMQPSSTFQVVLHEQLDSTATGMVGLMIGLNDTISTNSFNALSCVPLNVNFNDFSTNTPGAIGRKINGAVTTNAPFRLSTAASYCKAIRAPTVSAFIAANVAAIRVVSMAISLRSLGSAVTNKGLFTAGSLPCDFFSFGDVGPGAETLSLSMLQNASNDVILVPAIEATGGVTVTYNPTDSRNYDYFDDTDIVGPSGLTAAQMYTLNPGCLFILMTGVDVSISGGWMSDIVINYEFVPSTATIGFQMRDKFVDDYAIQFAHNAREKQPSSFAGSIFSGSESSELASLSHANSPLCRSIVASNRSGLSASGGLSVIAHPRAVVQNIGRKRGKTREPTVSASKSDGDDLVTSMLKTVISIAEKVAPALLMALL